MDSSIKAIEFNEADWREFGSAFVKARLTCGHRRSFNVYKDEAHMLHPSALVGQPTSCARCTNDRWIDLHKGSV